MDIRFSFIKFPLLLLVRVICNDRTANSRPSTAQDPIQASVLCFAMQTRLCDVWTFSCLVMLNRHIIKKYMRLLTLHITSWTSGRENPSFCKGKLSCYTPEPSLPPPDPAPSPFSIPLNLIYIHPHTVVSQRGAEGWQFHRRRSYLFLSETTVLIQQNNANSAEEALIVQNGWTHHAFICNRL